MARPGGPSGDDRAPDPFADGPGDERSLALSIPDDASELHDEVMAYRRELRAQRRRERLDRYTLARYWRPYGIPFPVVIVSLMVVGAVGGLLLALLPNPGRHSRVPLSNTTVPAGKIGGLLPDVTVQMDTSTRPVRDLRPGVFAIVPNNCGCADTIDHVAAQAAEFALTVYVVSSQPAGPQGDALTTTTDETVATVHDSSGQLQKSYYAGTGVTLAFVQKDGVVVNALHNVTKATSIHVVLTLIDPSAA